MESSFRGGSHTISEGSSTKTLRRSPGNVTTDTVSSNASVLARASTVSGAPLAEGKQARSPATLTSEEEQAGLPAAPPSEGEEALAAGLLRRTGTKDMLRGLFLLSGNKYIHQDSTVGGQTSTSSRNAISSVLR